MKSKPESYKKIKLLGEGSFGKAFLVQCGSDESLAVIKQIDIESMEESERKNVLIEAKIMEKLIHPNIIRFREIYKSKAGMLCIVMDYANGGDLEAVIADKSIPIIPENEIIDYICQICLALKHIHDRKIIHRDLKSSNVFLTKNKAVKLGDFGIARILEYTRQKAKTQIGTPYYLAPEIISNTGYSYQSDLWSLGVICYELCTRKYPFEGDTIKTLLSTIVKGNFEPIPSTYSKELKNLVESLLQIDPAKRPRAHNILKSNLIMSHVKNFLTETEYEQEFSHTVLHKINLFTSNQITNTENLSHQKESDLKNNIEGKSESVKIENNDKFNKLSGNAGLKNESKKHSQIKEIIKNSQQFKVDSTLTAKILGEIQKSMEKEEKEKKLNEITMSAKQESIQEKSVEEIKENSKNIVSITKECEIKQIIKQLKTFNDIEELAKSIISKEKSNFEDKQKVRNEMKKLINEEKKLQISSSMPKIEPSPPKEEDREDNLIKESQQNLDTALKSPNLEIENIINFLINSIGYEKYIKCYNILKPTISSMKSEMNFDLYKKAIKGILTENEEKEYLRLFITVVTIEQKLNKLK